MASTTETVEVELVLKAKEFRDQLKQASTDANKFNKGLKDVQKAGGKQDKDLQKLAKDANKFNKGAAKGAIDHEKALLGLMKKRHSEMKQIKNTNSKEFKDKRKEATETLELYTDISKARRAAEGGERGGGSGIGRSLFNGLKGGALKVAGMAFGAMTQRVNDAGAAAQQFRAGGINLAGDKDIKSIRDLQTLSTIGAKDTGYSPEETLAQAAAMSRATGRGSQVIEGQQFSRAGMLDMGQATGFMGVQARGGQGSAESKRDLERILTNAFANGLEKGRFGEYLEGLTGLVEGAQGRTAGNVTGAEYAKSLSFLDSSGQSGLRGARGAKVLSQLEQGFMGGGGAAGKAMSLSAMGFGTPGGNASYYEAMKQMQQGFAGEKGSGNMMKMLENLKYRYGGNTESAVMAGSAQTGLSYDIMEQILDLTGDSADVQKEIEKLTAGAVPLEEQMVDILKGELSEQAKYQSARQQQLVDQGLLATDDLNKIQESVNKMINDIWPIAIKSLDVIAKTLDVVAQAVTDALDFWKSISWFKAPKYEDMSLEDRASYDAEQLVQDITRQVKTGLMKENEGRTLLRAEEAKNERIGFTGARDKARAGLSQLTDSMGTSTSEYTRQAMKEQSDAEDRIKRAQDAVAEEEKLKERNARAADYVRRQEEGDDVVSADGKAIVGAVKELKEEIKPKTKAQAKTNDSGSIEPVTR